VKPDLLNLFTLGYINKILPINATIALLSETLWLHCGLFTYWRHRCSKQKFANNCSTLDICFFAESAPTTHP